MRRFALRDLRSDEGLGLIETVVSLLVFALIMSGLAASMVAFARSSTLSRARTTATAIAQEYTEKARAVGSTLLENCSNQTPVPPATAQYRGDGVNHTVATGTDSYCIPYQKTISQGGISFTMTRLVLARASNPDVTGQPQSEKYFVVQLSWTDGGGSAKTYELDTIFTQKGAIAAAPAQGIRFVIKDTNGNVVTANTASWFVSITGSGCTGAGSLCTDPTATTAEGTYSQLDLAPGAYTCTATETGDGSAGYAAATPQPQYNSGLTLSSDGTSITGSCTVTASTVTDFVTQWKSLTDCAASTTTGTVPFTVTDTTGAALANMTVTVTNLNDGTKTYAGKTGSNGTVSIKPPANWYTYTVTDTAGTYQSTQTAYPAICVVANQTLAPAPSVQMQVAGGCVSASTNGTMTFTVTDATSGTALSGFKVSVTNTSTGTVTAFSNTNSSGVSSKAVRGGWYTYTVSPPSGSSYQGSGLQGPTCLAAGEVKQIPVSLSTASCTRDTGHKGWLALRVVDQNNNPISGASIKLTNVNGDASPSAVLTGTDGKPNNATKSIQAVVDPYQYTVTAPNGNYLSSDTVGTFCVTNNVTLTIPDVVLQALMNVVVTVQNNDVLPWKTYEVRLIDPNDPTNIATQTVTVPNCTPNTSGCTRNPSAAITFSGLHTGNGWVIEVRTGTNNNLVDSGNFNFTTPLFTYTQNTTGYSQLAMTDDSGGA